VVALADLAESRDATTGGHVRRVCRLTDGIAAELHAAGKFPDVLTPAFMSMAGLASILHDVGKVATPDAILLKPGRHTPEERAIMEEHALIGETVLARAAKMVEGVSTLSMGAQIAGGHHEHFDGSGYPRQLKGHAIPLEARIVAVVDVFDALLHRRPYKEPWELDAVLAYLQERRNTQFDPDVLDALDAFLRNQQPDWIIGDDH
jgi:response regulator RpfG family c-di-GMP phosphodiesterase